MNRITNYYYDEMIFNLSNFTSYVKLKNKWGGY